MILDFCVFCGVKDGIEQHHVVPRAEGGTDDPANILSVCGTHHGLVHGVRRTPDISKLIKGGQAAAKARGKVWGRKSHADMHSDVVALAHRLRRQNPRTGLKRSYRDIASVLADKGHLNVNGQPYAAASIKSMLDQPDARAIRHGLGVRR